MNNSPDNKTETPSEENRPSVREFDIPPSIINQKLAVLRNIFPHKSRKELRQLLKNKQFMSKLNIRTKPKETNDM